MMIVVFSRGESNGSSDSECSDHEEEFYYTEEEVSVDTMTKTFADMHTSSHDQVEEESTVFPPSPSHIPDHDYPKKVSSHSTLMQYT
jgi:hypothetical protein